MIRFRRIFALLLCAVVTLATTGTPALVDLCCDGFTETAAPVLPHGCCSGDAESAADCCEPVLMLDAIDDMAVVPTTAALPVMATWDLPPIVGITTIDELLPTRLSITCRTVSYRPPPDPDVLSVFLL